MKTMYFLLRGDKVYVKTKNAQVDCLRLGAHILRDGKIIWTVRFEEKLKEYLRLKKRKFLFFRQKYEAVVSVPSSYNKNDLGILTDCLGRFGFKEVFWMKNEVSFMMDEEDCNSSELLKRSFYVVDVDDFETRVFMNHKNERIHKRIDIGRKSKEEYFDQESLCSLLEMDPMMSKFGVVYQIGYELKTDIPNFRYVENYIEHCFLGMERL